jgi:hypothetical protein
MRTEIFIFKIYGATHLGVSEPIVFRLEQDAMNFALYDAERVSGQNPEMPASALERTIRAYS